MTLVKRISACILCFVLLLAISTPVYAAESCTLIIRYEHEDTPVAGATFRLYRVADGSQDGSIALSGDFAGYPVDTTGDLAELAMTLYGFAALDGLVPTAQVTTDAYGVAVADGLAQGVYLVVGLPHSIGGSKYACQSQLVYLPWRETSDDAWNYEVTMRPKGTTLSREPQTLKVLKVWEGQGSEAYRPESIQVTLLRDGEYYDAVTLNKENNWRYSWTELPGGSDWQVVEAEVPEKFVTIQRKEGVTYVITNICDDEPPPPPPPEEELPQTGMLWWPVPVLMALGMLLIVLGIKTRRGGYYEEA